MEIDFEKVTYHSFTSVLHQFYHSFITVLYQYVNPSHTVIINTKYCDNVHTVHDLLTTTSNETYVNNNFLGNTESTPVK